MVQNAGKSPIYSHGARLPTIVHSFHVTQFRPKTFRPFFHMAHKGCVIRSTVHELFARDFMFALFLSFLSLLQVSFLIFQQSRGLSVYTPPVRWSIFFFLSLLQDLLFIFQQSRGLRVTRHLMVSLYFCHSHLAFDLINVWCFGFECVHSSKHGKVFNF